MPLSFFIGHVDALFQILAGAVACGIAFRPSARPGRARTVLRIAGPFLFLIGVVFLFVPMNPPSWRAQATVDQVAVADFPGPPTAKESTDTLGTVTVTRKSFTYSVPGKDIALFLSASKLPDDARSMTDEQKLEATLAYFVAQGSKVVDKETSPSGNVHIVTLRQDDSKVTMEVALAYVGDGVYRALASWSDGQEDLALTDRFIHSFRVSAAQPAPTR